MLTDSHCHLAGEEFAADLEAVAARAREAGVDQALCILGSEDEAELSRAAVVRAAWPGIRFATGVHPHHAGRFADDQAGAIDAVRRAVQSSGASAIGEIGLDYHYDFAPREVQQRIFRAQLRLARELDLPVVIHTREAVEDTFAILEEEAESKLRGVFHCFTGAPAMAQRAVALGFYVSFAGILTFPRAAELREVAAAMPLDRLLSETDAPYLAPVPHRGKRNEPAFVGRVIETLAGLHAAETASMARQIHANFQHLFGLAR